MIAQLILKVKSQVRCDNLQTNGFTDISSMLCFKKSSPCIIFNNSVRQQAILIRSGTQRPQDTCCTHHLQTVIIIIIMLFI